MQLGRELIGEIDTFSVAIDGRYESRNCKTDNNSTRSGATDRIVCNKGVENRSSECRICQQYGDTINHIISACPVLTREQYIKRHEILFSHTLTYRGR